MRRRSYQADPVSVPKYKYSFNQKAYRLSVSASLDNKLGIVRTKQNTLQPIEQTRVTSHFTLQKLAVTSKIDNELSKVLSKNIRNQLKLPSLKKRQTLNPELNKKSSFVVSDTNYYQSKVAKSMQRRQNGYLASLARQHFIQTIQALKIGRTVKLAHPSKAIQLSRQNPKMKTIFLDLDQTLIHCDELSSNCTVKLNFPVEGGAVVSAGIRVRPYCNDFIRQLSSIAEIIIFTASSASYADIVLDYLDPHKTYFSHRLYRQHCTLEKGYYTKDLRIVNRRLEDSVLVDNSGFCFMFQPQNGIPVLPYYHFAKDKELLSLLGFLKQIIQAEDVRQKIKKHFFWHKYFTAQADPAKVFADNYETKQK